MQTPVPSPLLTAEGFHAILEDSSEDKIAKQIACFAGLIMICNILTSFLESKYPSLLHFIPEVGVVIIVGLVFGAALNFTEVV